LFRQALAGAEPAAGSADAGPFQLLVVGSGFDQPTDIQFVPGSNDRAVVLQKKGTARLVTFSPQQDSPSSSANSPVVFDVAVRSQSELGLLGLAFSPKYAQDGLFYVNYNPQEGPLRTRIAEWHLPSTRLGKERAKETRILLEVTQPFSNHNGGQLAFGPDGMLYIGLGDGGAGGDPHGNGQNLATLLGKMLRIDVRGSKGDPPYSIPKDNPFLGRAGARPEIWAYGLRNPWRFSFDPKGRMLVGDLGQNAYEEIDVVERGDNLGWALREGRHCYPESKPCSSDGLKEPIYEYARSLGVSVTGGYVYTGKRIPSLAGKYVFADFGSGRIWALDLPKRNEPARARELGVHGRSISTFGRDASGELYAADFANGELLRFAPR
jgi:glucose/arabinose dehydrogenase